MRETETDRPEPWTLSPREGPRAMDGKGNDRTWEGGSTLGGLGFTIFPLESLDPACRIQEFLLAGEERMAARTDFDTDLFLRALRLKGRSAGAPDDRIKDLGMDVLLHAPNLQLTI